MCTLTWLKRPAGYHVFFNRDEKRARGREFAPRIFSEGEVQFLMPVDSETGGSWMGVNEYGLSLCLTNYYPAAYQAPQGVRLQSRGKFVPRLLRFSTLYSVYQTIQSWDLFSFAPFELTGFSLKEQTIRWRWDGKVLTADNQVDEFCFCTSSSFESEKVQEFRRKYYQEFLLTNHATEKTLNAFHLSQFPTAGPYAVCMSRQDAKTFSYSQIIVTPQKIVFKYLPEPQTQGEVHEITLPIKPSATNAKAS